MLSAAPPAVPTAPDGSLLSGPASRLGPKQHAIGHKLLPTPHKIHPHSAMTTQQLPSCPPPFSFRILPAGPSISSHHHSPLLCSAHSLGSLKGASQHPLTPAPHVPPACLSSRCKRSKRTAKIAEGEELVGLTSGGQKQLLLLSRQEVKEEG